MNQHPMEHEEHHKGHHEGHGGHNGHPETMPHEEAPPFTVMVAENTLQPLFAKYL